VSIEDEPNATHLYRITQEAVSNAVKHGHAKKVNVTLKSEPSQTVLRITDDGLGIGKLEPKRMGMGLRIMQYRADIMGARLTIDKQSKGGTSVTCSIRNSVQTKKLHATKTSFKISATRTKENSHRR
jgi:signal transduction histidine kinase